MTPKRCWLNPLSYLVKWVWLALNNFAVWQECVFMWVSVCRGVFEQCGERVGVSEFACESVLVCGCPVLGRSCVDWLFPWCCRVAGFSTLLRLCLPRSRPWTAEKMQRYKATFNCTLRWRPLDSLTRWGFCHKDCFYIMKYVLRNTVMASLAFLISNVISFLNICEPFGVLKRLHKVMRNWDLHWCDATTVSWRTSSGWT